MLIKGLPDAKCGPTCLAMVLSLYQRSVYSRANSPRLVAKEFDPGRIFETGGTRMEDFPEILRRCGHPISYTCGRLSTIGQLQEKLSPDASGQIQPVITQVFEKGDPCSHVVVIEGIEKGTTTFNGRNTKSLCIRFWIHMMVLHTSSPRRISQRNVDRENCLC